MVGVGDCFFILVAVEGKITLEGDGTTITIMFRIGFDVKAHLDYQEGI
jgi:hypothetical protein